jgi:hypothetical protein
MKKKKKKGKKKKNRILVIGELADRFAVDKDAVVAVLTDLTENNKGGVTARWEKRELAIPGFDGERTAR